jgi:hypothetical protein
MVMIGGEKRFIRSRMPPQTKSQMGSEACREVVEVHCFSFLAKFAFPIRAIPMLFGGL